MEPNNIRNVNIPYSIIEKVQNLVFHRQSKSFQKVHQTYVGLLADSQVNSKPLEQINQQNQYLMNKLSVAVLGNLQNQQSTPFQKITIEQASIYTKTHNINGKIIRLLVLPLQKYSFDQPHGKQSYAKMVMRFFLLNKFLKPQITQKITLISVSFMPKPALGMGGRVQSLNLGPHLQKTLTDLKKTFNLELPQIKAKLIYIVNIGENNQSIRFNGNMPKDNKVYVLTNDKTTYPLYGLQMENEILRLRKASTILLEKQNFVTTAECHLHFNYNQFLSYQTNIASQNVQDKNIVEGLWGIIVPIIYPIKKVKQHIYKHYKLQTESTEPVQGNQIPAQHPHQEQWRCIYKSQLSFEKLNQKFNFQDWKSKNNQLIFEDQQEENKQQKKIKPQEKLLQQYTQEFQLNVKFINQQQNLKDAMILDQINRISKDIHAKKQTIHQQTDQTKKYVIQRSLVQYVKIIIRFLKSIKDHRLFSNILQNYEAQFYEHLISTYLQAYDEFVWANKLIYGKMLDLSLKISDLKSSKKQILKVVKSVHNFTQIYKKSGHTIQELQTKKQLLQILLHLLEQNKSNERDRQIEVKILSTKYDLGSTYQTLATLEDAGNVNSKQLKNALKILFFDIYKHLFIDQKNFNTQYGNKVSFNELQLLQRISGILKVLGRLDLSIEIQKKLENDAVVQNYINRWLMRYRSDMGSKDSEQINKILQQAIDYFKQKFIPEKVNFYYSLMKKNCKTIEQKKKVEEKRLEYGNDCRDPQKIKKFNQKAKNKVFDLDQKSIEQIMKVFQHKSMIYEK